MKAFIQISKAIRNKYKKELLFVAALCKLPQRQDVKSALDRFLSFKMDCTQCFINSEPNEQCILGFENRSVND